MIRPAHPTPRATAVCPDGVLRLFAAEAPPVPQQGWRNPLCMWDVDTEGFECSNRRVLLDARDAGLVGDGPMADYPRPFPVHDGSQIVATRVGTAFHNSDWTNLAPALRQDLPRFGIHYVRIRYDG